MHAGNSMQANDLLKFLKILFYLNNTFIVKIYEFYDAQFMSLTLKWPLPGELLQS